MDTWKRIAVGAVGAVVVLGAIFLFMGGGNGEEPAAGSGDGEAATSDHDCETGAFEQEQGAWGGVGCQDAEGAATFTDTFDCQTPSDSAVGGSLANATAGTLALSVEDAAGTIVFEDTYNAGAHPVGDFVGEGEAGTWTVTVELSEDWSSTDFGIGAGCFNDGGGGGSGTEGCQANSDIESGGYSSASISCQDAQGENSLEATFQCADPQQGGANWDADVQAGEVAITVEDADGQAVVEETLQGGEQSFAGFGDGATGEWTLTAELSSGFEGSFSVQAQCPTE